MRIQAPSSGSADLIFIENEGFLDVLHFKFRYFEQFLIPDLFRIFFIIRIFRLLNNPYL